MRKFALYGVSGLAAALAALSALPASAASVADFYKGKTIKFIISSSPGGGYDAYGRTLTRHLGRHIPGNPRFVPQNMPGAGGIKAANFLFNVAPKDGSVFGGVHRGIAMEPLFGNKQAKYQANEFNWLGSVNNEVSVCVSWGTVPVKTIQDAFKTELIIGGSGANDTEAFPAVLNNVIGTKFKIISGYPSGTAVNLAMERREVDGRCGWSWSSVKTQKSDWIKNKTVNILLQMSLAKHPELPDVPLVMDFAKSDADKEVLKLVFARQVMGRPYLAPPGIPPERVAALRAAFDATMKDPKFIADIKKQKLELAPVSGTEIQKLVARIYATPKSVIARTEDAYKYRGPVVKVKVELVKHKGTITETKKGGRRLSLKLGDGKVVKTKVSGSRTAVVIGGKKDKRKNIKVGMVCEFTYPGPGQEAKKVDCAK
ncbi:MAG: tripartite tricarboxylate transporter substrate-binding protein [Alphaproteobacteria bacterium]